MRDVLLLTVVVVICFVAVFRPRWGLYGYVWFALMRPDVLAWSAGRNQYSFWMAVFLFAGAARYLLVAPITWLRNPITRLLLFLQIPIAISLLLFPVVGPGTYGTFMRAVAVALLIPILITTEQTLREFLAVMAFSVGALASKYGLFALIHGGAQFRHGYGGQMSDNNLMAHAFAMSVPMCWYARELLKPWWARWGFVALALLALTAVPMTHSRGSTVALALAVLLMMARVRRKTALVPLIAVIAIAVGLAGQSYLTRLATMKALTQEASANSRLILARAAVRMWLDHPWFGVGFGRQNQMALLSQYVEPGELERTYVIHNTYLQILVDSGMFAFLLYVALLFGTIFWLQTTVRPAKKEGPSSAAISYSIQTALVTSAVAGLTISRVEFDWNYFLLMSAAAWMNIRRTSRGPRNHAETPAVVDSGKYKATVAPSGQPFNQPA